MAKTKAKLGLGGADLGGDFYPTKEERSVVQAAWVEDVDTDSGPRAYLMAKVKDKTTDEIHEIRWSAGGGVEADDEIPGSKGRAAAFRPKEAGKTIPKSSNTGILIQSLERPVGGGKGFHELAAGIVTVLAGVDWTLIREDAPARGGETLREGQSAPTVVKVKAIHGKVKVTEDDDEAEVEEEDEDEVEEAPKAKKAKAKKAKPEPEEEEDEDEDAEDDDEAAEFTPAGALETHLPTALGEDTMKRAAVAPKLMTVLKKAGLDAAQRAEVIAVLKTPAKLKKVAKDAETWGYDPDDDTLVAV